MNIDITKKPPTTQELNAEAGSRKTSASRTLFDVIFYGVAALVSSAEMSILFSILMVVSGFSYSHKIFVLMTMFRQVKLSERSLFSRQYKKLLANNKDPVIQTYIDGLANERRFLTVIEFLALQSYRSGR